MKKYSKNPIIATEDVELPNISPKKTHKKKISDRFDEVDENILYSIIGNHSNSNGFSIGEDDTENDFGDNELLLERNKSYLDINDFYPHENSPIPMAVSTKDDPSLQSITFRFWFFTVLGAAISQFYYFRSNGGGYSVFFVLLVSHVLGKWMSNVLPTKQIQIYNWKFSLNPGPFNIKEHVCIAVAAAAGGGTAYATDIIAIRQLFYGDSANFLLGILLLLSTQMIGYGLAGFLRKYLVRPANMLWPSNLVFASLFTTLHGNVNDTRDKLNIVRFGSGYQGLGFLTFSLDWNAIGQTGPLYTPWWAQANFFFGVILSAWVIAPILWYSNVWDAQKFPLLATYSLNKNDQETGFLDEVAYSNYGPVFLSVTFAVGYFYSFIGFSSAISHVMLFYGNEIWSRFKASRQEGEDIHCRMMRIYEEIPNIWYFSIFVTMLTIAITICYVSESNLPWWGLLLAVALACVMVLPIGVIQAISNSQLHNINLLPPSLLGLYMKIPPKALFVAQVWGTFVGAFINYWTLQLILDSKRDFLDGTRRDPTGQWTGYRSQVFNTASIVWGLIGPARTFGSDSMYHIMLWGFLIGFLLPFPIYLLHRRFPNAKLRLITVPLICHGLSIIPGTYTNFIIMGFMASFLSQFWAYRYNYVLSASLDSASQIVTMFIFFLLSGLVEIPFPEWWGNNRESQGERCFLPPGSSKI
ncbi:1110_t:CDS:10 [Entrophospora sp. SA101]|nr:1110_t:CDS:10 [Entrophospora sp. SA101]CAJ0859257.1 21067_t:CDS:10 [Entrophospora sp. SA101]